MFIDLWRTRELCSSGGADISSSAGCAPLERKSLSVHRAIDIWPLCGQEIDVVEVYLSFRSNLMYIC